MIDCEVTMTTKNYIDFKLKMLDMVENALSELDKMKDKDERTALVGWISGFWQENIDALNAFAQMDDSTRIEVKKGLMTRANNTRKLLKEKLK